MEKSLIITEKPSVAQEFAHVLNVSGKKNGYIENEDWVITWCVGHLVKLSYPERYNSALKEWKLETLPFLPADYKYEIIPDVAKQYEIVNKCLHRRDVDTVYWAGDAGREGQLIEELIRMFGGVRDGMKEKRIWIDSQTEEAILSGIKYAKPMASYQGLSDAGIMRSIEDYAMGINFSRALTLRYGGFAASAAGDPKRKVIAVGRVMSCVLAMIVDREREINNFKETLFYRPHGYFESPGGICDIAWKVSDSSQYHNSPELYNDTGFKDKDVAAAFVLNLKKSFDFGSISIVEHKESKKSAPLLFNLAELQSECTKAFHISPSKTLEIAQSLYEKKLTTYPRTDARVLSSAVASVIDQNVSGLITVPELKAFVNDIVSRGNFRNIGSKKYTDDSKVSDHYAIIPTGKISGMAELTDLERQVFLLICKRFLAIFMEEAVYDNIAVTIMVGNESFSVSKKFIKKAGYMEITGMPAEEANANEIRKAFFALSNGMTLAIKDISILESKTSPPHRYTSGSMILAMENAGQLIEDEELREQIKGSGIGTSATRANIIDKLIQNAYVAQNLKTQVLTPTNVGETIYEVIKATVPELLVPETTAEWEKELADIEHGFAGIESYRHKLEHFVREKIENIVKEDHNLELEEITRPFRRGVRRVIQRHPLGVRCPKCGGTITASEYGFSCENNKKDKSLSTCDFFIGTICDVLLSDEQARELIIKKKTGPIDNFKGKNGKFRAFVCMKVDADKSIHLYFEFPEPQILEKVKCPKCGGRIFENHGKGFMCEHNSAEEDKRGCDFFLWKYGGKSIPRAQVEKLLTTGSTDVMDGFKSQKDPSKSFSAALVWVKEQQRIGYKMADTELVKGISCPKCGGSVLYQKGRGFFCENTRREKKCDFFVGKICEVSVNEDMLRTILNGGKTGAITGFKSSSGNKFSSALAWSTEEGRIVFVNADDKFLNRCKCPLCGNRVLIMPGFGYKCEHNTKDEKKCSFYLGKIAGKLLSESEAEQLFSRRCTDEIKGFTSKEKKKFSAKLKLKPDNSGIEFVFSNAKESAPVGVEGTDITCSRCQGKLYKTRFYFECGCGFKLPYEVAGHELSEREVQELMSGQEIFVRGFISKKSKMFNGYLQLDERMGQLKPIRFENKEVTANNED